MGSAHFPAMGNPHTEQTFGHVRQPSPEFFAAGPCLVCLPEPLPCSSAGDKHKREREAPGRDSTRTLNTDCTHVIVVATQLLSKSSGAHEREFDRTAGCGMERDRRRSQASCAAVLVWHRIWQRLRNTVTLRTLSLPKHHVQCSSEVHGVY